jgi:2-polyprenyl-3-methyl-5-hydroxy-6-metoxy-1,4-benzoquinol methylase
VLPEAIATPPLPPAVEAAARAIRARFAHLESPGNRHYFRALAAHLAGSRDDPCLPMYFEFALSANERGRKAADLIAALVPLAGKRALDVGCAYGGFLVALGERGAEPTGFDIDPSLLALAASNFRDAGRSHPVYCKDVTQATDIAPFAEAFDVVTCNDVIEHVADPAVAIRNIARMLKPGGLVYFEIPNRDAVGAVEADGHYQLFGITQLEREDARRYFAAHAPGTAYGVEFYLRLPEYRALFEQAGLTMDVLGVPAGGEEVGAIRKRLAALAKALPKKLAQVPEAVRADVAAAIARYLDEAGRARTDTPDAARDFELRYGTGFWRIVGHRTAAASIAAAPMQAATAGPVTAATTEPPAPAALAHKPFLRGTCNVCGKPARFFRDDPALDRESLTCEHCRSTSRYRSLARGILRAVAERTGIVAAALAALPREAPGKQFRVYDTQAPFVFEPCAYPIPDLLRRCDWIDLTVSLYKPGMPPGATIAPGVVNQNLERLTFPDASFDLVLTTDVMEHVRLDGRAHAEIARVLRSGGVYAFTVPHFRDRHATFERVRVCDPDDPASDEYLTEREYHGDANDPGGPGALSYRSYGTVLDADLAALGFDVDYTNAPDEAHAIRNAELFYCVKRR